MKLAIPSYRYPQEGDDAWRRMLEVRPHLIVINPASGPGSNRDLSYTKLVKAAKLKGIRVLGYIATGWAHRPLAEVLEERRLYSEYYASLSGFFYDEASTDRLKIPYYKKLVYERKTNVINPGTIPDEAYAKLAFIQMNYETSMDKYLAKEPPKWVLKYPATRFWHCVFGVPTIEEAKHVADVAKRRNAGYCWITSDAAPNEYDEIPDYMEELSGYVTSLR